MEKDPVEERMRLVEEAIKIAGSMTNLSKKMKVNYQSISDWKTGKKAPNAANARKMENATEGKIKAIDILPNYNWDDLEKKY